MSIHLGPEAHKTLKEAILKASEMFIDFFDKVYVINLKERVDRLLVIEDELNGFEIPFTVFEATKDVSGVKGLFETMKRLMQEIVDKRYSNVLVLEDDASFLVPDPVEFLRQCIPQLPKDYQLFHLGLNLLSPPRRMSENILKVVDCYSTHAIAYSYEGAKFVLERLTGAPVQPYDQFIRTEILPCARSYCTFPMLATQRLSMSSIENKEVDWGRLMAMTYSMMTKNL